MFSAALVDGDEPLSDPGNRAERGRLRTSCPEKLIVCPQISPTRKQTGLLRGSRSWLFDLRLLFRLCRIDFRPRRRWPDVQEAVIAQGADGIAVG
jgi:hypothetical protein